jgi:hypothetical protein
VKAALRANVVSFFDNFLVNQVVASLALHPETIGCAALAA